MNEKINSWFIVSILLFLLLCVGTGFFIWYGINVNRELQTAIDGTKNAKLINSQVIDAISRNAEQSRQNRQTTGYIKDNVRESGENRKRRDESDSEIRRINDTTREGIRKCIEFVEGITESINRSGKLLEETKTEYMD